VQSRPGCRCITTDTCVPISRLADCLLASVEEADASGIPYFLVGHVGDGNFHFGYLIDPDDEDERALAEQLNHQLVAAPCRSAAPAPASTAWGCTRWAFCATRPAPARWP
jgi:D-lactate dehydrogenase (cytochrome)